MIGILAPYTHCEATAAAIRLAELCLSYGEEPRLMAVGPCRLPVHDYWDRHVWSTRDANGLYLGAQDCHKFVHLWNGFITHTMTTLVAMQARHVLVPCWQHLSVQDLHELNLFDKIVCPSQELHSYLLKHARCPLTTDSLTWTRFDAGLPFAAADHAGPLHVAMMVNGATIDVSGLGLLRMVEGLLATYTDLRIYLLHSRSWPDNDRRYIRRLRSDFAHRFQTERLDSFNRLTRRLHEFDWTVIPWPRADFGIAAARSIACGTPVVTYDVAPFNEIVRHEHNGHLVRCDITVSTGVEAPSAVPDMKALSELCFELFANRTAWNDCRRRDWKVAEHSASFSRAWADILNLN